MTKKRWGRRVAAAISWSALCFSIVYLQPKLKLDVGLVELVITKATWIAGLLIIGLSGTDAVQDYARKNER